VLAAKRRSDRLLDEERKILARFGPENCSLYGKASSLFMTRWSGERNAGIERVCAKLARRRLNKLLVKA
jgi:hypothetical protein